MPTVTYKYGLCNIFTSRGTAHFTEFPDMKVSSEDYAFILKFKFVDNPQTLTLNFAGEQNRRLCIRPLTKINSLHYEFI